MSIPRQRHQSQLLAHLLSATFPLILVFILIFFSKAHCLVFLGGLLRPCVVAIRFTNSSRLFNECTVFTPKSRRIQL